MEDARSRGNTEDEDQLRGQIRGIIEEMKVANNYWLGRNQPDLNRISATSLEPTQPDQWNLNKPPSDLQSITSTALTGGYRYKTPKNRRKTKTKSKTKSKSPSKSKKSKKSRRKSKY